MAVDSPAVKQVPQIKQSRNPISRKQVESIISRSVAVFGIVFGAQTVPIILGQTSQAHPLWLQVFVGALYLSLIFTLVASIIQRSVRFAHGTVSVIFLLGVITWPFAVTNVAETTTANHWLYYLITVATATAAISFSTPIATTYLFAVPAIYGIIRLSPQGGGVVWELSVLDSLYGIILGGAVMIIVTMLRQAATAVDVAQAGALDRYAHAVRQHATEVERVQVDSIVHDSVLTTLLSAARAYSPEAMELASTMAGNAIGYLREAALVGPDDGSTVRLTSVSKRISTAAATMSTPFELRTHDLGTKTMPTQAAEAVYSAAVQAMVNSLQHAGQTDDITRWLAVRGLTPSGIEVQVGDTGAGFTVTDVPTERLGVRVSIVERVANAGGIAEIDSVPGEGTVITIRWPDANSPRPNELPDDVMTEVGDL